MAINRRRLIQWGLGGLLLPTRQIIASTQSTPHLFSCHTNQQHQHFVSLLDLTQKTCIDIPLPDRGHGVALHPSGAQLAVFGRRPGWFVDLINLETQTLAYRIQPQANRHYYGHGVFSADGQYLFCSENDYANGVGMIGIYATKNGDYLGEIPSHGIGPHEIGLIGDDNTLVVANGGIHTHPDLPRIKTNLATMAPNLTYVDIKSGGRMQRFEPPAKWRQLSIRHLAIAPDDDQIAIAMQYEGQAHHQPPLIALQQGDQPLKLLSAPPNIQRKMRNYCGSVAFDKTGQYFAVSSPRGGLVTYWSTDGGYLGVQPHTDACGLAALTDGLLISDGQGELIKINNKFQQTASWHYADKRWDNHMIAS